MNKIIILLVVFLLYGCIPNQDSYNETSKTSTGNCNIEETAMQDYPILNISDFIFHSDMLFEIQDENNVSLEYYTVNYSLIENGHVIRWNAHAGEQEEIVLLNGDYYLNGLYFLPETIDTRFNINVFGPGKEVYISYDELKNGILIVKWQNLNYYYLYKYGLKKIEKTDEAGLIIEKHIRLN